MGVGVGWWRGGKRLPLQSSKQPAGPTLSPQRPQKASRPWRWSSCTGCHWKREGIPVAVPPRSTRTALPAGRACTALTCRTPCTSGCRPPSGPGSGAAASSSRLSRERADSERPSRCSPLPWEPRAALYPPGPGPKVCDWGGLSSGSRSRYRQHTDSVAPDTVKCRSRGRGAEGSGGPGGVLGRG